MKKVIALFGPPGVGKSTLIKLATEKGISAYDLEGEANTLEDRKKALKEILDKKTADLVIIGSADLGPKDYPNYVETILLLPPKDHYMQRVKKRDELAPVKQGQTPEKIYDLSKGWKNHFKKVVEAVGTPEETLKIVLSTSQ